MNKSPKKLKYEHRLQASTDLAMKTPLSSLQDSISTVVARAERSIRDCQSLTDKQFALLADGRNWELGSVYRGSAYREQVADFYFNLFPFSWYVLVEEQKGKVVKTQLVPD